MTQFQIKKGLSTSLFDEAGNCLLSEDQLINGCWYLTTDTVEVYVALEQNDGSIKLSKLNDIDFDIDVDLDSFEERISKLENEEKVHTYAEYSQLPSTGVLNHMYAVLDKNATYIFTESGYICVGEQGSSAGAYDVINGGTARN